MQNLIGQSIGRYRIIEPLGEGGMAVVYKAYDTHLECEVAVKVIRIDNLPRKAEERALKRFEREAKAVARLNHPNIVKVTDYGEEDGKPYLVMPYLPGGTLKQLIKERGQIPWQEAASILIPIAEALAYAHEEKVIHRDIKPSNILLTRSGQPMLTDFGVAKIIEDEATQDLTGTSATVGTPEYMAPEQITSKSVDARADLYSLGVVFYEMVTGRKPFEADTPLAVLFKHASDPLPRPSLFVPGLSEKVEQFLFKALAKDTKDRYQNSEELCQGLRGLTDAKSSPPQLNKPVPTQKTPTQNTPKRKINKWIIIGSAVLVLLVGSFLLGSLRKNPPAATEETQAGEVAVKNTTEASTLEPTVTETATPSGGEEANVVFSDSFKNNKNQWDEGENDGTYADAFFMFQDGVYHWKVYSYQLVNMRTWPGFTIDGDFTMTVQAKQLTDSPDDADYGLIFRSPDDDSLLSFTVSNQNYSVYVFKPSEEWVEIVPWTTSDVIRPGEYNELTVQRVGYDYTYSVNGVEMTTFTYSDISEGQPGLNVDIFPEGTTIEFEFDDFLITAP